MKKKTVRRDISFFLLGFFACFLLYVILDWSDFKKGFIEGWNDGGKDNIEVTK